MRTRQNIRRVPYAAPSALGMEVMTFARLYALAPPGVLTRPLRPEFHSVLLVTGGETTHAVDFDDHSLRAGSALWVKPGQVQRFGEAPPVGDLILFQADFLLPGTRAAAIADHPAGLVTDGTHSSPSLDGFRRILRREYAACVRDRVPTNAQVETLRHLLSALILSLHPPDCDRADPAGLDQLFRELLERDFASARDVEHYARELGYSKRTLDRAVQAAGGESPKQAINRRVALEARRLLAHTDHPIATVTRELGFSDPSNFAAFFAQQTGESPTAFRLRASG